MNINQILHSGEVERFHAVPMISKQSISEHSWNMSIMLQGFDPDCRKEAILYALTHDCTELVTGDIPATAKWDNPDLKVMMDAYEAKVEKDWGINFEPTTEEKALVKSCDLLEGMRHCYRRYCMGERMGKIIFERWIPHAKKQITNVHALQFMHDLISLMEKCDG